MVPFPSKLLLLGCVLYIPLSLSSVTLLGEGGISLGSGLEFLVCVGISAEPILLESKGEDN